MLLNVPFNFYMKIKRENKKNKSTQKNQKKNSLNDN